MRPHQRSKNFGAQRSRRLTEQWWYNTETLTLTHIDHILTTHTNTHVHTNKYTRVSIPCCTHTLTVVLGSVQHAPRIEVFARRASVCCTTLNSCWKAAYCAPFAPSNSTNRRQLRRSGDKWRLRSTCKRVRRAWAAAATTTTMATSERRNRVMQSSEKYTSGSLCKMDRTKDGGRAGAERDQRDTLQSNALRPQMLHPSGGCLPGVRQRHSMQTIAYSNKQFFFGSG